MEKFEIAFAIGAVAIAGVLAGVLYALYPSSFGGNTGLSTTSTASDTLTTPYDETTSTAATTNSTADQNATNSTTAASVPAPAGNAGY